MKRKRTTVRAESILEQLHCPITQDLPRDPVICEDGHVYERSAILQWISKRQTSPLTLQPITTNFRECIPIRNMIETLLDYSPNKKTKWLHSLNIRR
jgi:hypothetical protein